MGYNGPVEKLRKPAPTREMQNSTYSKFLKFLFVVSAVLLIVNGTETVWNGQNDIYPMIYYFPY